jgi:hypothetical protein
MDKALEDRIGAAHADCCQGREPSNGEKSAILMAILGDDQAEFERSITPFGVCAARFGYLLHMLADATAHFAGWAWGDTDVPDELGLVAAGLTAAGGSETDAMALRMLFAAGRDDEDALRGLVGAVMKTYPEEARSELFGVLATAFQTFYARAADAGTGVS